MLSQIGSTIRRIRRDRGMSQQDLAKAAQITASFMSLIERGHRAPSLRVIDRIADALGLSHEALLWESVEIPSNLSQHDRRLCELAKSIVRRMLDAPTISKLDSPAS